MPANTDYTTIQASELEVGDLIVWDNGDIELVTYISRRADGISFDTNDPDAEGPCEPDNTEQLTIVNRSKRASARLLITD